MRKKITARTLSAVLGLGLILTLTLSLPGCSSGSDDEELLPVVEAPANVRATAYAGVTRITWGPAKNATAYDIYRQPVYESNAADAQAQNMKDYGLKLTRISVLAGDESGLLYDDIVSFDNILQNGRKYIYTVVSCAGGTGWKNSSGRAAVKALIPAEGDRLETPANVSVKQFVSLANADYVQVTWDATPGRLYTVSYRYGTAEGFSAPGAALIHNLSPKGSKGSIVYPLLAGNNSIQIQAALQGHNNYYYAPGEPVKTPAAFLPQTFTWPADPGFSGVRVSDSLGGGATDTVRLAWNCDTGVSGYEIYRAVIENGVFSSADWSAVDISSKTVDGGKWTVYDSDGLKPERDYTYMIIGKNAAGMKTLPDTTRTAAVAAVPFAPPVLTAAAVNAGSASPSINLSWSPVAGISYTLRRAEITYAPDSGAPPNSSKILSIGEFGEIASVPAGNISSGTQTVSDTTVTPRHSYRYEVVARKDSLASTPGYCDTDFDPFNPFINISMAITQARTPTVRFTAGRVNGSGIGGYYKQELVIEVWRRQGGEGVFTKAGSVTVAPAAALPVIPAFPDSGPLTPGAVYYYKMIVKDGERELINLSSSAAASITVR
jgi:hypothetical protein